MAVRPIRSALTRRRTKSIGCSSAVHPGDARWCHAPARISRTRHYGKEHDQLTSLSYYGLRFYDRLTLSWTQADPLYRFSPDMAWDEPRRATLYSFSLNNPLRYIDPDGRDSWWDRFTDWVLEVDNDYRVSERAEGAGKTVAGGAGCRRGGAL